MARRWAEQSAFRPDPNAAPDSRPTWRQSLALLAVLALVSGAVATVSYLVRPDRAQSFDLLHGSLLIGDQFGPVSIDLGTGKGTLQIRGADQQAGVTTPGDLQLVPFDGATMLLNRSSGEFNMVDSTGFVVKRDGGVTIGGGRNTSATGIAAGQLAYIVRTSSTGTTVLLVGPSTVATAAANPTSVKPRASITMKSVGSTAAGGAASANGDLWALFTSTKGTVLRRLTLPADSSTGAQLRSSDHGTVDPLSAVESATENADGSGSDVVGVASPGRIRVISPDLKSTTVRYPAPAGLDTVVPTSSAQGRLSWLLHGTDGWSVVSVATSGGGLVGPVALRTIEPDARLAPPAASLGSLYTMLRSGSSGTIYRIGLDGKVGAVRATYPQKTAADGRSLESASFADGYLIARKSRVIVDSPGHYLALSVFTDGSRAPLVIEKTNLTSVVAANGADALTQDPVSAKPASSSPPGQSRAPTPVTAPQINNKINCKQVNQKPHVPQIASVTPSARSVGLSWTYPILDSQDCNPSTYVVSVRLLSNNAPQAPGSVTLQDHLDTVVGGLFPSTQYEFTVTAYINGQSTPSQPVRVTTGKEGPAAPKSVQVTADSSGNWNLSWAGCGSVANKCVPAQSWSVRPFFCDGRSLSASPGTIVSPADPSSVAQPPAVFKGGGALLGRSLQFRIQGTGVDGTVGDTSTSSACVQSWSAPDAGAIHLTASTPPLTSSTADTTQTTASLSFDHGEQQDLGGVGATVNFQLLQAGAVVQSSGAGTATSAVLRGIKPGVAYQVQVVVSPPGHPAAAVTVGPVAVTQAASAWPAVGVRVPQSSVHNQGAVAATALFYLTGLDAVPNETFDVTYQLRCGNAGSDSTTADAIAPGDGVSVSIDRVTEYGSCVIQLTRVVEHASGVFGGTPAPNVGSSSPFSVDQPSLTGVSSGDFTVTWTGDASQSAVHIEYTGGNPVLQLSASWSVTVTGPSSTNCSFGYSGQPALTDVPITDQSCINATQGTANGWKVVIMVSSLGSDNQGPFEVDGWDGLAPSYSAPKCDASSVAASWSGTRTAPTVTVSADQTAIPNCSNWTFTIVAPGNVTCGSTSGAPAGQQIAVACRAKPAKTTWSVRVTWTDATMTARTSTVVVKGNPPT